MDKGRGVSLMVWGCFAGNIRGPLVPFYERCNSETYITTLEQHLVPFIENLPADIKNDAIFQQDNAPIHTAKITKNCSVFPKDLKIPESVANFPAL
jgi:hypothetical protein